MLWPRLRSFFRSAVRRSDLEREMAEELQFHLDQRTDDLMASRGLSRDAARRMARIEFGSVEKYKDENRESLGLRLVDDAQADLRFAFRTFGKSKGFTVAAIATLALGIGANTAVFSVVDALLLRNLPVRNSDELVTFDFVRGPHDMVAGYGGYGRSGPTPGTSIRTSFLPLTFERFRDHATSLSPVFGMVRTGALNVMADGVTDSVSAILVSGEYFHGLGVGTLAGRTLEPSDDIPDAPPAAVISHRYWQRRFASDPAIVGKTIEINRVPTVVVGVTPAGFDGVRFSETTDITLPVAMARAIGSRSDTHDAWMWTVEMMGRLKPGVTREQAYAELVPIFQQSVRDAWALRPPGEANPQRTGDGMPALRVRPGAQGPDGPRLDAQKVIYVVSAVVAAVLLLGSANLANLLLVRASGRRSEVSMRLALGASRSRVVRQLLTESLLLAVFGAVAGAVVAFWCKDFMLWLPDPPSLVDARLDARVLAFTACLSTITALAFGIGPALRATRTDLTPALRSGSQKGSAGRGYSSKVLLAAQVAISLSLLVGAGLLARTLHNLSKVDVGFSTENLLTFRIKPAVQSAVATSALYDRLAAAIDAVPGVKAATHSTMPLIADHEWSTDARAENGVERELFFQAVRPNFFEAIGIPLLSGRALTALDSAGTPKVAVVNQTMARQFFGDANPVGRRFQILRGAESQAPFEIVGIVGDSKYSRLNGPAPPTAFLSHSQVALSRDATFEVRTMSDPLALAGSIREAVNRIDPHLPLVDLRTQEQQIALATGRPRAFAWLTAGASLVGLLLASIGLYGIVSYETSQRTNEIGIRMALGARAADVIRLVMTQTMLIVTVGAAAGCALAVASGALIRSMLFDVTPGDPMTMGAAAAVLLAVAFLAAYVPARRAARLDPTLALRYE